MSEQGKSNRIVITLPNWSRSLRRTTRESLTRAIRSKGLEGEVKISENKRDETITLEPISSSNPNLAVLQGDVTRFIRANRIPEDRVLYIVREQVSEDTDNNHQGATRIIDGLRNEVTNLGKRLGDREARIAVLESDCQKLEERLTERADGQDYGSRGDMYVEEVIRMGRVEELRQVSDSYDKALRESEIDRNDDVNRQIIEAVDASRAPFESSSEYLEQKDDMEQARQIIELARAGNRFVNEGEAQKLIDDVEAKREEYDTKAKSLGKLREVFEGRSVRYLVTTGEEEEDYEVNVILPIEDKPDARKFSELEKDLIAHIHDQWSNLKEEIPGTFTRANRQGLVQYTFYVPKDIVGVEKMKEMERQIVDNIFDSQGDYAFGALGLRIDIETLTDTTGRVPASMKIEPGLGAAVSEREPVAGQEGRDRTYEELDNVIRSQTNYRNIPTEALDALLGERDTRNKKVQLAILQILSEEGKSLYTREINDARLVELLPEVQSEVGFKSLNGISAVNSALRSLRKKEIIEKDDNRPPRNVSYRIKEEYRE